MKVGFVNTFLDIAVLQLAINTWGYYYFELWTWPEWARVAAGKSANGTALTTAAASIMTTSLP